MNNLTQHLLDTLRAIDARDKPAARDSIRAAERCLGSGFHAGRVQIRAVDCALDISRWQVARDHAESALAASSPEPLSA